MEEVTDQTQFANTPQPQAIENVQSAPLFNLDPVAFNEKRDELIPQVKQMQMPPYASRTVAQEMQQSPEHAAAIAPDAKNFSMVERIWGDISNKVKNKLGPERRMNDLLFQKLNNNGQLPESDAYELGGLQEAQKNNYNQQDYNLPGYEGLLGDIAAGGIDMGAMFLRHKALFSGVIGTSTAAGAGYGAWFGGLPGAVAGGVAGFGLGFKGASAITAYTDGYQSMAGASYGVLDETKNEDGQPIDEATKQSLAKGIGVMSGAVQAIADVAFLKNLPILSKFLNPAAAVKTVLADEGMKAAILAISKSALINGGATGAQEILSTIGEEIGKTIDKDGNVPIDLWSRIAGRFAINDKNVTSNLVKSTVTAGLTGAAIHSVMLPVEKGIGYVAEARAKRTEMKKFLAQTPSPSELLNSDYARNKINVNLEQQKNMPLPIPGLDQEMTPTHPVEKATSDILEFQKAVEETTKLVHQTATHKESPQMAYGLEQKMIEQTGIKNVYFDLDEISKEIKNEDDAQKVMNAIDPSGVAAKANTRASMPTHKFLEIVRSGIPIDKWVRLDPEGPNPTEAQKYGESKKAAEAKKADLNQRLGVTGEKTPQQRADSLALPSSNVDAGAVATSLGSKEVADAYLARLEKNRVMESKKEKTPEVIMQLAAIEHMKQKVTLVKETLPDEVGYKATIKKAIDNTVPESPVFNEEEFVNQPIFTKPVGDILPKKEVDAKNAAVKEIRQNIAKNINETAVHEMNHVIDITEQEAMDTQKLIELDKLENSFHLDVVERFKSLKDQDEAFGIDRTLLTKEQRERFKGDPEAKRLFREHNVFNKEGGMSPDEAAANLGISSGDALLDILSRTPTREEIATTRAEIFRPDVQEEAKASVDLNHTALDNAYQDGVRNAVETAQKMREIHWSKTKQGMKRAAFSGEKVARQFRTEAETTVDKMKLSELSPNQFKIGQRKNAVASFDHEAKGQYLAGSQYKDKEAINIAMTRAVNKAIGESNRVIKFVRRFNDPEIIKLLKDTGNWKAVEEILDVYNFSKSKKGVAERGAFAKWADDQLAKGNGNFSIPPEMWDLRQSVNDMTVEQVKVIGDRLKSILHIAKEADLTNQELEAIAKDAPEKSGVHPDYNPEGHRNETFQLNTVQKGLKWLSDSISFLKGMEHVVLNADVGKVGGFWNEKLFAPLKGNGKYSGQGEAGKHTDVLALQGHFQKIVEQFGKKEWNQLRNTKVVIPEFKDNPRLFRGNLTKWELFQLMLNMGNESNRKKMVMKLTETNPDGSVNFTTTIDTIKAVLERELPDQKYPAAAQNIWNLYKSYYPRVEKLHEEMTGIKPKFIPPNTYFHNGEAYEGGYFPVKSTSEMSLEKLSKAVLHEIDLGSGEKKGSLTNHLYADDMTKHSYTENRTDDASPLDFSSGLGIHFEMLLHDLNFRKPIRDALRILTHPEIRKELANRVGLADYKVMLNTVVRAAGSIQAENTKLFDSTNFFRVMEANFRNGIQSNYLIFNPSSVLIQPTSMIQATGRLGKSGVPHILNVLGQMQRNPHLMKEFYKFAGEVNPMIRDVMQGLDENMKDPLRKYEPKNHFNKFTEQFDNINEKTKSMGFHLLAQMDQIQKVVMTLAAYSQYMAGEAEGHPMESIAKMTAQEKDHAAKVYASSAARLTLTAGSELDRAPIQSRLRWATMFYNDARNSLNNTMRQYREIRWNAKSGQYGDAAAGAVGMVTTLGMIRAYQDIVRGYGTPWSSVAKNGYAKRTFDPRKLKDPMKFGKDLAQYLAWAPLDIISGDIPFVRDINFTNQTQSDNPRHQKDVATIMNKPFNDIYWAGRGVGHLAENALYYMHLMKHKAQIPQKERDAMGFTASYFLPGAIPIRAGFKLYDRIKGYVPTSVFGRSRVKEYAETFDKFEKENPDDKNLEALRTIKDQLKPGTIDKSNSEQKD